MPQSPGSGRIRAMMDAPASPLILTKLRVPTPRPRIVPRTRLVARLIPEPGTGLVLVCAPAGYGKTTLLAEWARSLLQDGVAVAWCALDATDDDPISFGSYLVAGLADALGPASGLDQLVRRLRSSPEVDLQGLLPTLINAVAANGRECVLILDDYHLIGAPAIHSALAFLLERLPENMHVAIGSRSDPPLPLARLRSRGTLREVRAADLRFTADEATLFLNETMRLDLSPEQVAALAARYRGLDRRAATGGALVVWPLRRWEPFGILHRQPSLPRRVSARGGRRAPVHRGAMVSPLHVRFGASVWFPV